MGITILKITSQILVSWRTLSLNTHPKSKPNTPIITVHILKFVKMYKYKINNNGKF